MKRKIFPDSFGSSPADSRKMLEQASQSDPRIGSLLSKLSPEDMAQLMQVLGNPEQARSILATPQAQALLNAMTQKGGQSGAGGE